MGASGASAMRRSGNENEESSGDSHSAEDAVSRKRRNKKRSTTSGDECSDDEDSPESNVFMVLNGAVPERLKNKLVVQRDLYQVDELKDIVDVLSGNGFPVLCGVDCGSDLRKIAQMHSCLKMCSVEQGAISWHVLYDERNWEIKSPLLVVPVIPASESCVERSCGLVELKKKTVMLNNLL